MRHIGEEEAAGGQRAELAQEHAEGENCLVRVAGTALDGFWGKSDMDVQVVGVLPDLVGRTLHEV